MNILAKSVSKNHLKLGIFQLKLLLYTNSDPTYGNTFWLEIQKQKLIWKTSDFIMALQSGWGFEDLKNVIFKHFQGQFS